VDAHRNHPGPEEICLRLLMLVEAAPIALAPLLCEINSDALGQASRNLRHPCSRDLRLGLKQPRASTAQIAGLVPAITLFDFAPHVEELWRCRAAQQKGLTGRDSPECAAVLYSSKRAALTSRASLLPEPSSPPAVPVPSTPQTRPKAAALL